MPTNTEKQLQLLLPCGSMQLDSTNFLPVAMMTQLSFLSFSTELMIFHWSLHEKTKPGSVSRRHKDKRVSREHVLFYDSYLNKSELCLTRALIVYQVKMCL